MKVPEVDGVHLGIGMARNKGHSNGLYKISLMTAINRERKLLIVRNATFKHQSPIIPNQEVHLCRSLGWRLAPTGFRWTMIANSGRSRPASVFMCCIRDYAMSRSCDNPTMVITQRFPRWMKSDNAVSVENIAAVAKRPQDMS